MNARTMNARDFVTDEINACSLKYLKRKRFYNVTFSLNLPPPRHRSSPFTLLTKSRQWNYIEFKFNKYSE